MNGRMVAATSKSFDFMLFPSFDDSALFRSTAPASDSRSRGKPGNSSKRANELTRNRPGARIRAGSYLVFFTPFRLACQDEIMGSLIDMGRWNSAWRLERLSRTRQTAQCPEKFSAHEGRDGMATLRENIRKRKQTKPEGAWIRGSPRLATGLGLLACRDAWPRGRAGTALWRDVQLFRSFGAFACWRDTLRTCRESPQSKSAVKIPLCKTPND